MKHFKDFQLQLISLHLIFSSDTVPSRNGNCALDFFLPNSTSKILFDGDLDWVLSGAIAMVACGGAASSRKPE
jgi:hypothetical protein